MSSFENPPSPPQWIYTVSFYVSGEDSSRREKLSTWTRFIYIQYHISAVHYAGGYSMETNFQIRNINHAQSCLQSWCQM